MAQNSYAHWKTTSVLASFGQHLVTLSDANKDALLSKATQLTHSSESRSRADAILSRLRELNSDIARQFHPKKDALSDLRLRMICSDAAPVAEATDGSVSSYIAVSYCWHYPQQWTLAPAAADVCEGWEISRPMMQQVMALRQSPEEGVWLDKLCINQGDQADILTHIGVMDAIYRSARRLVILLEDIQLSRDEEEAALVFAGFFEDFCREVKDARIKGEEAVDLYDVYFPRRTDELRSNDRDNVITAVKAFAKKILNARWFARAWCAHESRMTKHQAVNNPLFLCFGLDGRVLRFEFRFIYCLGLYLSDSDPLDPFDPNTDKAFNDSNPETIRQLWWRIRRLMANQSGQISAMQHIVDILSFGCLMKRDLLSIALNTANIPLFCEGQDVQCVEEVVWKFTLLVLASGDLVPLVSIGKTLMIPTADGHIISWAINPTQTVLDTPIPNPLPESVTAMTREYIELDLLVFESLPQNASPSSQEKASRLIARHNLKAVGQELLAKLPEQPQSVIRSVSTTSTGLNPNNSLSNAFQHLILSLALDNGLDWILNFPSAMQHTTASSFWNYGTVGTETNPALAPAARYLLALLQPLSNQDASPETTSILEEKLAKSLTALLDPRLFLLTPNPRNLPLSPGLGRAALTPATSNRSYVAVPTCLAHLPGCYARAWIVEAFDPDTAEPERLEDLLPSPELTIVKEGEEAVFNKLEDAMPVLSSDYEDRREPRNDGRKTWRMRRRQVLFGCHAQVWGEEGAGLIRCEEGSGLLRGGEGLVLLRRQRVYGCQDYPWKEIMEAGRRIEEMDREVRNQRG